jgi:hypothetical protein
MQQTKSAQQARFLRTRFLRFAIWALAMFITCIIVGIYAPHRIVLVPCIFLAIMVPAVLIPMQPRGDKQS